VVHASDTCDVHGLLQVQHGALHSSCILLTCELQAKIGVVGLSRLAYTMMKKTEEGNSGGNPPRHRCSRYLHHHAH
jgi:hypothetical protein